MALDIKKLILKALDKKGEAKAADIVKASGFSRAYVNRFLKQLREEGKIILIGKANKARYIKADKKALARARKSVTSVHKILKNVNLAEDAILDEIKRDTGIFIDLPKNILDILDYAFTEMLNNAIEHSKSKNIEIIMKRDSANARFDVADKGIGIFNNIMQKKKLHSHMEAIQDLLKGKQTTAPEGHSGEGIFFTSKVADLLTIQSSKKKLIFNNIVDDVFVHDVKKTKGTKVVFVISLKSKRRIENIFKKYAGDLYEFSKTVVAVRLYKMDNAYISRSQARRVMTGLDKFKTIVLDFKNIKTVGQAFADEIFRVWQGHHRGIRVEYKNANENIEFMIRRALK